LISTPPYLTYLYSECRGFTEEDFEQVAVFFDRAVQITEQIHKQSGSKLKDFKAALEKGPQNFPELVKLGDEVRTFARKFPTIGF
jgi:glycine hydroxymethyltransferase